MDPAAERLVNLEMKFTFLEDTLDALNQALLDQAQQLERIERRTSRIERRLQGAQTEEVDGSSPPSPPL